ncbi:MAG: hypothetical protein HXY52_07440 [Nitrospirae bacterium]|jgi:hypothetical protein|nr:hypothetical protein [Nitrospirota bacterium]
MNKESPASMLNEPQRRGLSSTFRILEEMLLEIETMINSDGFEGNLMVIENDVSSQAREKILMIIELVREKLNSLSKQLALEIKQTKMSSQILADLSYCWEILEGSKAKKLKRYGDVATGIKESLDPDLNIIITLILDIEHILRTIQK